MLLLLGGFLLLMLVGLPVALAMAVSSLVYILVTGITPDVTLAQRMIAGVESFPLLAVPFFILAGNLMNIAGVTGRIYKFAVALVGWMRGGLGHVNIVGSVIFSGMSGTALADAAGLGTIEIKAMKDHGYSTEFAVGVTAGVAGGYWYARPQPPAVPASDLTPRTASTPPNDLATSRTSRTVLTAWPPRGPRPCRRRGVGACVS